MFRHRLLLNLCSKILVLAGLGLWGSAAYGVNLSAVYYASCQREVGVIIHVDQERMQLLTLDGSIKSFNRFDIIYLASYPIAEVPIDRVTNADAVNGVKINTLFNDEIVTLAEGWPVDFSEQKISFLSLDGQETVIDRNSIWSVEIAPFGKNQEFSRKNTSKYQFVHPYSFAGCSSGVSAKTKPIYPQQLWGDRLEIRKELDRLRIGYEKVEDYRKDQRFYPVPQIYGNTTSLGLWYNYGSRHARSAKRTNDLIPAITSQLSEGPFGFQRLLVTGSAPLHFTVHEEPQTQFFYRLKADYVHFSYFFDIDRLLIGEEPYKWRIEDLSRYEDRMCEVSRLSGGFDYGHYAIGYSLSEIQYAVRHEDSFFGHRGDMSTMDASYEDRYLRAEVFAGRSLDVKGGRQRDKRNDREDPNEPEEVRIAREAAARAEELKPDFRGLIRYYRANLDLKTVAYTPRLSVIYRDFVFYIEEDRHQEGEMTYGSNDITVASYFDYKFDADINLTVYLAGEYLRNRSGVSRYSQTSKEFFPKAGMNWSLTF